MDASPRMRAQIYKGRVHSPTDNTRASGHAARFEVARMDGCTPTRKPSGVCSGLTRAYEAGWVWPPARSRRVPTRCQWIRNGGRDHVHLAGVR